jgi:hypothetical protein
LPPLKYVFGRPLTNLLVSCIYILKEVFFDFS